MQFKQKRDESGIASIITVIFMSIIFSILIIAFVRLAITEQRASIDDDLTTRAYYAAESGLEDAQRAIKGFQNGVYSRAELNGNNCAPPTAGGFTSVISPASEFDVEYSCQLLDFAPIKTEKFLETTNQSFYIPLNIVDASGTPADFDTVIVKWHIDSPLPAGDDSYNLRDDSTDTNLPTVNDWGTGDYPAMLALNFMKHEASFNRNSISNYFTYLNPTDSTTDLVGTAFASAAPFAPGAGHGVVTQAACDASSGLGDYACTAEFDFPGAATEGNHLRITNLYRPTHIAVEVFDGATPLFFSDSQIVADVTGRAGDVFRRVQARYDISKPNLLPDYAISSAEDICKNFLITNQQSDFDAVDDTSCLIRP